MANTLASGYPLCTDSRTQTGTSASISISRTCTIISGATYQLLGSVSGTPTSGALTGNASGSGSPAFNETQGGASGAVHVRDWVVIDAPELTGTHGTFTAAIELTGSVSATSACIGADIVSAQVLLTADRPADMFQSFLVGRNECTVVGTDTLPTTVTGRPVTFTYGVPFQFNYSVSAISTITTNSVPSSGSTKSSITFRWLGMTGLAPGATVTSSSGIDWSKVGPAPPPAP